jgi:hypothetical protein
MTLIREVVAVSMSFLLVLMAILVDTKATGEFAGRTSGIATRGAVITEVAIKPPLKGQQ